MWDTQSEEVLEFRRESSPREREELEEPKRMWQNPEDQ